MSNYRVKYSDELYHHGILGQKWGKKNGPPYPLSNSKRSKKERALNQPSISSDEARKRELMAKGPSRMSNAELREVNNRLQLESQYNNLVRQGNAKTKNILTKVGDKVVEKSAEKAASAIVEKIAIRGIGNLAGIGASFAASALIELRDIKKREYIKV